MLLILVAEAGAVVGLAAGDDRLDALFPSVLIVVVVGGRSRSASRQPWLTTLLVPPERDGWVRIRVEAFGLNRPELKVRLGG